MSYFGALNSGQQSRNNPKRAGPEAGYFKQVLESKNLSESWILLPEQGSNVFGSHVTSKPEPLGDDVLLSPVDGK